ncbi:MAG: N-acetylmuramoyl-L-alanine amidase, partial [Gemmiger sp.]
DGRFAPFLTITEQESTDPGAPRVKPSERAARAADRGAQLLVSIHGNADPVYDASGFECFPVPPGREYYAQSLDLAQRIVDGFSAGGANIRGVNGVRFMYFDDDDNEHFVESTDATVNYNSTYTVLEDAPCPAVLTEQCFLTNAADFDRFGDEDGCRLSAQILYDAICAWYEAGGAEK